MISAKLKTLTWMRLAELARLLLSKMDVICGRDWVPHGGIPTCLTVPRDREEQEGSKYNSTPETSRRQQSRCK